MTYSKGFPTRFRPVARPEAIVSVSGVRFTVLTSRLMRLEYSPTDTFEDRPSQAFWYREQPVPDFRVQREDHRIQIDTSHLRLHYRSTDAGFTPDTLCITLQERDCTWHYGDTDPDNLRGTARTLDQAHGAVELEPGLVSRAGWAVVDDTERLVFDGDGWLTRPDAAPGYQDLYFFGYGHDYAQCLRDFCQVSGQVPLLPRWVLGNWWSRYWEYSAGELLGLMQEFRENRVPLSVCIVDMDWHITDTGNASSGWTGYTWNRDLFPDPPGFIQALHKLNLKTALNLHPALGVYPHEEQYPEMAERMGIDPSTEVPVPFDIADPQFTRAYFEILHHPLEAQGVDFWWLDWQQGTSSEMLGLDPLWWLNHLHFYDLGRDGEKRSFIFSRWGGLGNHRYPIGFSGDTVVSWESLGFQPSFTSTAANVGYGWWSHDIGGHMGGIEDAELFTRWVQYGAFSPILRLHCTKNLFHERRPWGYDAETLRLTRDALQLRHALIPYLYTMSWQNHATSIPPIRPMYYDWPMDEQAYHCPDQYTFGSELIAIPFITPADPETRMSRQVVWLSPGQWFGFFNGLSYPGDGRHAIYGGLDDIPVFARAGAIVPLAPKVGWGGVDNPDALEIHVFPGADNQFELYEDDDIAAHSLIRFSQTWEPQRLRFEISAALGDSAHLPERRTYTLLFRGITRAPVAVEKNGTALDCTIAYDQDAVVLSVAGFSLTPSDTLAVTISAGDSALLAARDHREPSCRKLVRACQIDTDVKQALDTRLPTIIAHPSLLADFELRLSDNIIRALSEIIAGAGVQRVRYPADGSEGIVLWNNQASTDVTYRFVGRPSAGWLALKNAGPVPEFTVLRTQGTRLQYISGTSAQRVGDVASWFQGLQDAFRPEIAHGVDVVIQFNLGGDNGCQAHAHISEQALTVTAGTHARPDLIIEADANDWLALVNGEADPTESFLSGRLQVSGDLTLAMHHWDLMARGAEHVHFGAERWKLTVDYLGMLALELGESG